MLTQLPHTSRAASANALAATPTLGAAPWPTKAAHRVAANEPHAHNDQTSLAGAALPPRTARANRWYTLSRMRSAGLAFGCLQRLPPPQQPHLPSQPGMGEPVDAAQSAADLLVETAGREVDVLRLDLEPAAATGTSPALNGTEERRRGASPPLLRSHPDVPQRRVVTATEHPYIRRTECDHSATNPRTVLPGGGPDPRGTGSFRLISLLCRGVQPTCRGAGTVGQRPYAVAKADLSGPESGGPWAALTG